MKRKDSEEIRINVNNAMANNNQNSIVKLSFLLMLCAFVLETVFFGLSVAKNDGFSGGLMASVFCVGYMISAYLIVRRNPDSTFISILYLILIYGVPCCWMGIWYFLRNYASIYDLVQFLTIIVAIVLAVFGVVHYYRNNFKSASIFGLISMIVSIIGLILGGTAEIVKCVGESFSYIPLIGIGFFIEAGLGVLPLVYLFKTL